MRSMLAEVQPKVDAIKKDYVTAKQLVIDNPEQSSKIYHAANFIE